MNRAHKIRSAAVLLLLVCVLTLLIVRLLLLQGRSNQKFRQIAEANHHFLVKLAPRRGAIYDRNMRELAISVRAYSVYAVPPLVEDKEVVNQKLAAILAQDEERLKSLLARDKSFVWLARKVSDDTAREIRRLNLNGIDLMEEERRLYPNGKLACHILGFAGLDNCGLEGLELLYDRYLRGEAGWRRSGRDGRQREIISWGCEAIPPADGFNLVLTIDQTIQYIAEQGLKKVVDRYCPRSATIIIMNPADGGILALANWPDFDPNRFSEYSAGCRRNRAVTDILEPGSVFKVVTAAAVLSEGKLSPEEEIFCEQGLYRCGRDLLHDYHPFGNLTFRQVIIKSSNIGTVKAASRLEPNTLYEYVHAFGFGSSSGIDLPGEVTGQVQPVKEWLRTPILRIPIGHGVAVTPLQLVRAISVIANDGVMVKPRIVERIQDRYSQIIKSFPPVITGRVIPEETAEELTGILTNVVEEGTGRRAGIPGFRAAGKTGTAQKIEPDGSYSHRRFTSVFAGFAPAEKPIISAVVVVDEPHPAYYGGVVAAPVFAEVVGNSLKYLNIPPDRPDVRSN